MEKLPNTNETPEIKKSNVAEHYFTEREKQEAITEYEETVEQEIEKMYQIQEQIKSLKEARKSKKEYDFVTENNLSMEFEQCKKRVERKVNDLEKKYNVNLDTPDYDATLANYAQGDKEQKEAA